MVLKRNLTAPAIGPGKGRSGAIHKHAGKGATEQVLPSRGAVNTLTQGDPLQRTMQNYAKASPMPMGGAPTNTGGVGPDTGSMDGS